MFYSIPALIAVDAERTDIKATHLIDPIFVGTGSVRGGILLDGTAEFGFIDMTHRFSKHFKSDSWVEAFFTALECAEQHK